MSLTSIFGQHAASRSFTHSGRTITVRPLTQKVKAQFEEWMRRQAMQAAALAGDAAIRLTVKDCVAGHYSFFSENAKEILATSAGNIAIASILMDCSEDEVIELLSQRGEEVARLIKEAITESIPEAIRRQIEAEEEKQQEASADANPTVSVLS